MMRSVLLCAGGCPSPRAGPGPVAASVAQLVAVPAARAVRTMLVRPCREAGGQGVQGAGLRGARGL